MSHESEPRLRFADFKINRFPNGRCRVTVTLQKRGDGAYSAEVEGVGGPAAELRTSAQAALQALEQVVEGACTFELLGVKAIKAFDTNVVIVALSARKTNEVHRLVGSYLANEAPERGAAIAVLNATNRFLGNQIFAR